MTRIRRICADFFRINMAKKLFLTLSIIAFFASCGTRRNVVQNPVTFDEGVVINGIRWATRNVDAPGTFVQKPENAGGLFTWYEAQNACPRGWRVPTRGELQSLVEIDSEWTTYNDVNGRFFGIYPNQIFLPAVGWRYGDTGNFSRMGEFGNYWSTQHSTIDAMQLWFSINSVWVQEFWKRTGLSVRCVAK